MEERAMRQNFLPQFNSAYSNQQESQEHVCNTLLEEIGSLYRIYRSSDQRYRLYRIQVESRQRRGKRRRGQQGGNRSSGQDREGGGDHQQRSRSRRHDESGTSGNHVCLNVDNDGVGDGIRSENVLSTSRQRTDVETLDTAERQRQRQRQRQRAREGEQCSDDAGTEQGNDQGDDDGVGHRRQSEMAVVNQILEIQRQHAREGEQRSNDAETAAGTEQGRAFGNDQGDNDGVGRRLQSENMHSPHQRTDAEINQILEIQRQPAREGEQCSDDAGTEQGRVFGNDQGDDETRYATRKLEEYLRPIEGKLSSLEKQLIISVIIGLDQNKRLAWIVKNQRAGEGKQSSDDVGTKQGRDDASGNDQGDGDGGDGSDPDSRIVLDAYNTASRFDSCIKMLINRFQSDKPSEGM